MSYARFEISVNMDISVLRFYGYIKNIDDYFEKKNIGGYFNKNMEVKII